MSYFKRVKNGNDGANFDIAGECNNAAVLLEQLQAENTAFKARLDKVMELPCKVGDTVYIADAWGKKVHEFIDRKIEIFADGLVLYYQGDNEQPITPDIWGKTVFLIIIDKLTDEDAKDLLSNAWQLCRRDQDRKVIWRMAGKIPGD